MNYNSIENSRIPKSSFIHVEGTIENNINADYVINVDSIEYIEESTEGKTIIKFSNKIITIDHEYQEFIEEFLNQVNLLAHINKY